MRYVATLDVIGVVMPFAATVLATVGSDKTESGAQRTTSPRMASVIAGSDDGVTYTSAIESVHAIAGTSARGVTLASYASSVVVGASWSAPASMFEPASVTAEGPPQATNATTTRKRMTTA
jgi:hypothetical protein